MTTVHINPDGIDEEYLRCLNLCFGHWGDQRQFDWYFRRKTAYPDVDLVVLKIGGRVAAGSAVTYRRVALPNEKEIDVGIMTGSWTLPQVRGQGCFTRIIGESVSLTAQKGGALMLAFVAEENASFHKLAKAGAALFPAFYLCSTPQTRVPEVAAKLNRVEQSAQVVMKMSGWLDDSRKGYARFVYPTATEFGAQFVFRPGAAEILGDDRGSLGIVEKKRDTDILQLHLAADDKNAVAQCMAGFLDHALAQGRKLFLYSTRPAVAKAWTRLGLAARTGYIAAFVADGRSLQSGLETPRRLTTRDSAVLAQADSPCFAGPWDVQSGDRA